MTELMKRFKGIAEDPSLSFAQKARYLSLEAENSLPYPELDEETAKRWKNALSAICTRAMRLSNHAM